MRHGESVKIDLYLTSNQSAPMAGVGGNQLIPYSLRISFKRIEVSVYSSKRWENNRDCRSILKVSYLWRSTINVRKLKNSFASDDIFLDEQLCLPCERDCELFTGSPSLYLLVEKCDISVDTAECDIQGT